MCRVGPRWQAVVTDSDKSMNAFILLWYNSTLSANVTGVRHSRQNCLCMAFADKTNSNCEQSL